MAPRKQREEGSGLAKRAAGRGGFSLVEVALALGVFSFCFIAVLGLLPMGINTNRDTVEQTRAAGIARVIQGDLETAASGATVTGRFGITLPATTAASTLPNATLFFAEDCASATPAVVASGAAASRYRADVCFGAQDYSTAPVPVRILVTWPALSNPTTQQWPTRTVGNFEIVTMLHR